jgi:hypothetical protein
VTTTHGGQGPTWHLCHVGCACPHARATEQRAEHVGGGTPQRRGGGRVTAPHVHEDPLRKSMCPQGGQTPVWHGASQACTPQGSARPHGRRQTCAAGAWPGAESKSGGRDAVGARSFTTSAATSSKDMAMAVAPSLPVTTGQQRRRHWWRVQPKDFPQIFRQRSKPRTTDMGYDSRSGTCRSGFAEPAHAPPAALASERGVPRRLREYSRKKSRRSEMDAAAA